MSESSIRSLGAKLAEQTRFKAAKDDLYHFQRLIHPLVVPNEPFLETKHQRAIAYPLETMMEGKDQRVLMAVPPRWFKSFAASVALPAWALGRDPAERVICASYGQNLANDFARQSRDVMMSTRYRSLYPKTRLVSAKPALDELLTTANGYRIATSVHGTLTGKGASLIVVDDPLKAEDASSQVERDGVYNWFKGSTMSRFGKPLEARVVVVMQRLHNDDLIGRLLGEEGWTYLCLPGEAEKPMQFALHGGKTWHVQPGQPLFPERFGHDALKRRKSDMGEPAYNAQVQQNPSSQAGAMIKLAWFNTYDLIPHKRERERTIQVWDTALTDSDTADYSVGLTFAIRGKLLFLIDVLRQRMPFHELEPAVVAYRLKHRADKVIVEGAGTGIALMQSIRDLRGLQWLYSMPPKGGKKERAAAQLGKLERGRVYLPKEASWLNAFTSEVAEFPNGRHDDQVDALVYFLRSFDYKWVVNDELSMWAGWTPGEPML